MIVLTSFSSQNEKATWGFRDFSIMSVSSSIKLNKHGHAITPQGVPIFSLKTRDVRGCPNWNYSKYVVICRLVISLFVSVIVTHCYCTLVTFTLPQVQCSNELIQNLHYCILATINYTVIRSL